MRACSLVLLFAAAPLLAAEPLVDFSIFKSFYRPEVVVRYQHRGPIEEIAVYQLTASLRAENSRDVLKAQKLSRFTAAAGELRFDTSTLTRGRYAIDFRITDPDGKAVQEQTLQFPVLADPAVKSRLVTVRPSDHMLIVQGKPFFPLGIYESPGNETYMRKLAEAGFNLCHVPGAASPTLAKLLDTLVAHGMHVWISASHLMDFSTDAERKQKQLTDLVEVVGDHPGLLCWESIDEPAWGKQSAEGLYDGYCFLRALDQQHIIWTNHAPRNTIQELAHFNRATDIAGCDIYPVPEPSGHSDLPNKTISVTGDETDKSFATVNTEKPIFMVLQGFGWAELSPPDPKRPVVMPTFAQSRFMAYDAIVHGANGILYWGTHHTKKPSQFWSELRSLVSELAALRHVLASETLPMTMNAIGRPRMIHKRHGGFNYIFLVNEKPDPAQVTLTVPATKAGSLKRLFERQQYRVARGKVSLELAGYDVAVLTDNLNFPDKRKDYMAEWVNAPATPPASLEEPGNAIRNAGFEVDEGEDGVPDSWSPRVPLTATLSEDAHSGKYSLRLQGLGGEMAPLAVQSKLTLQPSRKYRFTAWVKGEPAGSELRIYTEWVIEGKFYAKCLPWTKGTGQWQQVTLEFESVPPPSAPYAVVQVRGEGAAYFDDLKMELVE